MWIHLNSALLYCITVTGLEMNIWHLLASLSLNNKTLGVIFLHGKLCQCLSSVCLPPICLLPVGHGQFSCPTICFQSDFCWSRINDNPHYLLQPSSAAFASVFTSVCGKKVSLFLESLWEFCLVFRLHLNNLATSTQSNPARKHSLCCKINM